MHSQTAPRNSVPQDRTPLTISVETLRQLVADLEA